MNAIKTVLLLAFAVSLVLGWMMWRGQVQDRAFSSHDADAAMMPYVLTSEIGPGTYGSNDSPPKLDAPDSIKPTIEPDGASPFATPAVQQRGKAEPGAVRFEMKDFGRPAGIEDSVEFRAVEPKARSDWQTPPRLNLKPGGLSTPFSKPDWYDHPPLNRPTDEGLVPKPRGGL